MVTSAEPGPPGTPPSRPANATQPAAPAPAPPREPKPAGNPHGGTDHPGGTQALRYWRWDDTARAWTAGVVATLLTMVAAGYAVSWYGADTAGWWSLSVAAVAGVGGALLGRLASAPATAEAHVRVLRQRRLGVVLLTLAALLGTHGAWVTALGTSGTAAAQLAGMAGVVAVTLALAGLSTAAGRGALLGAVTVVVTTCLWELGLWVGTAHGTGMILGALSVVALGFVPRLALLGSGLTRLDDQRSRGTSVSSLQVDAALAVNHRLYAPTTVTLAFSAGAGGWLALLELTPWTVALTLLFVVLLCSRARAYPLALEVVTLTAVAVVLLVRLSVLWADVSSGGGPLLLLGAVAVAALVVLTGWPAAPGTAVRERSRHLTNLVESLCVVLLAPVAAGAFGAYGALLNSL